MTLKTKDYQTPREPSVEEIQKEHTLDIDIKEIRYRAIEESKSKRHVWRQRGELVFCASCTNEHGINVGTAWRLVGIDEKGNPKLERSALHPNTTNPLDGDRTEPNSSPVVDPGQI